MNTDHDRDRDQADRWTPSVGDTEPQFDSYDSSPHGVVALLDRIDRLNREVVEIAALDVRDIAALIAALSPAVPQAGPAGATRVSFTTARRHELHLVRKVAALGMLGGLLITTGGVATAAPGSLLYPLHEAIASATQVPGH